MRIINGKQSRQMDVVEVAAWAGTYPDITIDLGAGDGRFVRHFAEKHPERGAIALDLCETNLRTASRKAPGNALFVVADALALPGELGGLASHVTINFPWGSLLRALIHGDPGLLAGLAAITNGRATLEMVVNAGALAEMGLSLEAGGERIAATLRKLGAMAGAPRQIGSSELRGYPTTWAKRLAFGRDPRAVRVESTLARPHVVPVATAAYAPVRRSAVALADGRDVAVGVSGCRNWPIVPRNASLTRAAASAITARSRSE